MMRRFLFSLIASFTILAPFSFALELHPLFSDHAVLQQGVPVPVWGRAKPGATVTVTFARQEVSGKADGEGRWMVVLAPLVANLEPAELIAEAGKVSKVASHILVGEVWVASGQSNMAQAVRNSLQADRARESAEKGECKYVRLFRVPVAGADRRCDSVGAVWREADPKHVERFSAVGFYFASKLSRDRSVPVGIIQAANGGTNAHSWINSDTLASDPAAKESRDYYAAALKRFPSALKKHDEAVAAWKVRSEKAKADGQSFTERAPREPLGPEHPKRPAAHYNAMVAPLQPFAMRGVIWYQGEANARSPFYQGYCDLMFALVEDWRADWAAASGGLVKRRDFPFYAVQLPNFGGGDSEGWPRIREEMLHFWKNGKNTGMVVLIDKGDAGDIHPRNKLPVGERLARFSRAHAYGEDLVFSGPIYKSIRIDGDAAFLSFEHLGAGLVSVDGEPLRHFEIAGANQVFYPAEAGIEGQEVIVRAVAVPEPRAVRYAWKANPEEVNFTNQEGLPASPFRTDSW